MEGCPHCTNGWHLYNLSACQNQRDPVQFYTYCFVSGLLESLRAAWLQHEMKHKTPSLDSNRRAIPALTVASAGLIEYSMILF